MSPKSSGNHDEAHYLPWKHAWENAHYAVGGFYVRGEKPSDHFRTNIMTDPSTHVRIIDIACSQFHRMGSPTEFTVLDLGAGGQELTCALREFASREKLAWKIIPRDLSDGDIREITPLGGPGVLIAHELLDDIPMVVAELDDNLAPREVHVDARSGHEIVRGVISDSDDQWLADYWPATVPGARREVGVTRDRLWERLLTVFDSGCAIMIDYCTSMSPRVRGEHDAGTLTGYRHGRVVRAVPDGSTNITAHVCIDSLIDTGLGLGKSRATTVADPLSPAFTWLVQEL